MSHELHPLDQTPIEKFYIFRDYSHSDEIIFKMPTENELPGMLLPHHTELTNVVKRIQDLYTEAESCNTGTYCQGCLACLTGYLLLLCCDTQYEKKQHQVKQLLAAENKKFRPHGINIRDPGSNGLRCVEVEMYRTENES